MSALDCDLIQSVIEHMNEDHSAAVLVYVQAYAGRHGAESAVLSALDSEGMQICYREAGDINEVRVAFPQPVLQADEIRSVLVDMAKEGRELLKS